MARANFARPEVHFARPEVQLGLAATLIAAIYGLALVVPLPVWAGQPVGPPAPGQRAGSGAGLPGLILTAGFVLALCGPFRPYVLALRTMRDGVSSTRLVLALTAVLAIVCLAIYPRFGSDLFEYLGYERLWTVYHDNPLITPVSSHPQDWTYAFVWFRDRAPAYGPLWVLVSWPFALLAGESPTLAVAAYKLLALASYVACCALIWTSVEPTRRLRALLLFAWSPLVLFEVLGKAHNDALTALSVMAAVWLASRHRAAAGLGAAVAGALIKASALAVMPVIAVEVVRSRRWRALIVGVAMAAALAGLVYAPFWAGTETPRAILQQTARLVWSPGTLLVVATDGWLGSSATGVRAGLAVAWAVGCLLVLRRTGTETLAGLASASGYLSLLTLLLLTTAFYAHYLVPVVALAAVSGDRRLERLAIGLSVGGLAAYGVELLSLAAEPGWIGSRAYLVLGSLVTLAPAAPALRRGRERQVAEPRAAHQRHPERPDQHQAAA